MNVTTIVECAWCELDVEHGEGVPLDECGIALCRECDDERAQEREALLTCLAKAVEVCRQARVGGVVEASQYDLLYLEARGLLDAAGRSESEDGET